MATFWALDRLDDGYWAVLENDDAERVVVPRSWLPSAAREGSVLRLSSGDTDGLAEEPTSKQLRFAVDEAETERRRQQVEELRQNLPRGPRGDFEL